MSFVIGTFLALRFLEWPWNGVVIAGLAAFEVFEISIFLKWRKVKARMGPESMIGQHGTATTDCSPRGQVRVKGQLWNASCPDGVEAGARVVVTGVDGIGLKVARA